MQSSLLLPHVLLLGLAAASAPDNPSHACSVSLLQRRLTVQRDDPLACHNPAADAMYTPLRGRKPVVWVHIKKAAGTTVCCEARRRERIPVPDSNCNYGRELVPGVGYGWPSNWTCEERASLMAKGHFTWTAIERPVYPRDLCHSSFLYGTILRSPLDFIESIFTSKPTTLPQLLHALQPALHQGCQVDFSATSDNEVTSSNRQWIDNFATRSLGGYDIDAVPLGKMNASHLEHAKDVLRRFDAVLLFDLMAEQHSIDVMEDVIGWHIPWERSHANPTTSNATLAALLSPQQLECLASLNHLDAELVAWVRAEYYP